MRKLIEQKKGYSILGIMTITIIAIFLVGAFYSFFEDNLENATGEGFSNSTMNAVDQINQSQTRLQENLDSTTAGIRNLTSPTSGAISYLYGLQGAVALLLIPLAVVDIVASTIQIGLSLFDWVPTSVRVSILLIISLIIIYTVLRFIFGKEGDI